MTGQPNALTHQPPWWFWLPTIALCVALAVVVINALLLDKQMRFHLSRLISQSVAKFLSSQGTTGLGFLSPIIVSSLAGLFLAALILWLRGGAALREHIYETIVIALIPVLCANVLWFGTLVARSVITVVYEDQTDLSSFTGKLAKDRDEWKARAEATEPAAPSHSIPRWKEHAGPQSGPIGPIAAYELVAVFSKLPRPCSVKITVAPDKPEFGATLGWLISSGSGCTIYQEGLANIDHGSAAKPTDEPGVVVHWNENFKEGEQIAHFFESLAYKVRISHQLPPGAPLNLIWIDIGPGEPSKLS